MAEHDPHDGGKMSGLAKLVFGGFAIVAGYYLFTEHTAHVLGALPLLLFLSCPIMHLFMHHGHKHGGGRSSGKTKGAGDAGAQ
ncbi:hypothetical protein EBBID32_11230 [Sphingobium indicum BiD32]|uniref:DUF2933 domain-containing protein n=1 Tax=Sphingobium indicum BiD32 TaxID=1301087 RepID=N1MHU1_9SPHN|nr:DUF2933 domain-containing protein [Sphingobium indicum]CCW16785.1 hypothetical protein EBBID32_11230 [Sphingobium indicum BiD32]